MQKLTRPQSSLLRKERSARGNGKEERGETTFLPSSFLLPITPRASLLSQERRLGTSQLRKFKMIHDVEDLTGRTLSFIYSPAVDWGRVSPLYHINRFCKFFEFNLKFSSILSLPVCSLKTPECLKNLPQKGQPVKVQVKNTLYFFLKTWYVWRTEKNHVSLNLTPRN